MEINIKIITIKGEMTSVVVTADDMSTLMKGYEVLQSYEI